MAAITIDGTEYESDTWSDEAKNQLNSIQFCDVKINQLEAELAAIKTARSAYGQALKTMLPDDSSDQKSES